jgi:Tfp pilus assembly protein PilE
MSETKKLQVEDVKVEFPTNTAKRLYEELKKIIGNGKITHSNVVTVLLSLMQTVEQYDDVHGVQKKALVLDTLNHLIEDQVSGLQEATEMKLFVRLTLPTVIDTFVSIDKKESQIKLKKGCGKLFACCSQQ